MPKCPRHFGTGAEVSDGHFGAEVSWCRSVRTPHAVLNYSPVLTAAICYVLTEKATVITTNLQASVRTQAMLLG